MNSRFLRLTLLAALAGALALPAAAQTTTAEPGATAGAEGMAATQSGAAPAEAEEDDDDNAAAAPAASAEGTQDSKGKFDYGPSGILARDNRMVLAPLTLASGQPVAAGEYTLTSGGYYRIDITADGSAELALSGGDFFRAIWVNEIVVNDIEIRPMGVHSLEFDAGGTATLSFVAITPGRYTLSIPGSTGETQQAVFNIR